MNDTAAPDPRHVEAIRRLSAAVHRQRWRAGLLVLALAAAGVLANGLRFVPNGEAGVVRRFGRVVRPVASPGALYVVPFVDALDRVAVGEVREMDLSLPDGSPLEVTTGDENLLAVRASSSTGSRIRRATGRGIGTPRRSCARRRARP